MIEQDLITRFLAGESIDALKNDYLKIYDVDAVIRERVIPSPITTDEEHQIALALLETLMKDLLVYEEELKSRNWQPIED